MERNKNAIIVILTVALAALLAIIAFLLLRPLKGMAPYPVAAPEVKHLDGKRSQKDPYEMNQIRNTISKNNGQIRECYLKFIASKPKVTDGKVLVDWQISPDGKVLVCDVVSSEIKSPLLEGCILDTIKSWMFPPPPSDRPYYTSFTYNFKRET